MITLDQLKRITEKFMHAKKQFYNKKGDHLSLLELYNKFDKKSDKSDVQQWAYNNFLYNSTCQEV